MVTSVFGRIFLEAYNKKYNTNYDAKAFFVEKYYPLFFDSSKYMQWVQNSPFVQMKKNQKVENLTKDERREKLGEFINKVDEGFTDASVAIGYAASEDKEFATTSGQVTNIVHETTKEDIYFSWIGAALGVGLQGGISILFNNPIVLLDIYEGWKVYRAALNATTQLKGNQISSWNGQWLVHRYDEDSYYEENPMANFDPFTPNEETMSVKVQSWTKVLIAISKTFKEPQMIGYVYNFGQTNTTIGFIPFALNQIRKPIELYQQFFGSDEGKKAETLFGTAFVFAKACQAGAIGLKAMEPKGLKEYMINCKMPKNSIKEDEQITFHTYIIWLIAMLNNQDLWAKAQEFATDLQTYSQNSERGKVGNSRKVDAVMNSNGKSNFINSLVDIVADAPNKDKIEKIAELVNNMPADNVPYFLTLVRFNYSAINNNKK